jgi:hypothetical protein
MANAMHGAGEGHGWASRGHPKQNPALPEQRGAWTLAESTQA